MSRPLRGFTLIEVLVALGIVAITLVAGLKATMALTDNAQRQADSLLEDRVRVLERIATDSGSNIAAQIESLRDSQPLLREPAQ